MLPVLTHMGMGGVLHSSKAYASPLKPHFRSPMGLDGVLRSSQPYAPLLAAVVPALNGVRLVAIGSGLVENERAVASISREGDRRELLRGPLFYVLVLVGVGHDAARTGCH